MKRFDQWVSARREKRGEMNFNLFEMNLNCNFKFKEIFIFNFACKL